MALANKQRGTIVSQSTLSGSCLCGSVRYEILGIPRSFYHCHCRRCRKASGTGHASNVILKPDAAEWLAGEELVRRYKMPDAERYGSAFCSNCGSPLPRIAPDLSPLGWKAASRAASTARICNLQQKPVGLASHRLIEYEQAVII
ncbi:MAG: GFA family protein [Woeseiaceae bacterium]